MAQSSSTGGDGDLIEDPHACVGSGSFALLWNSRLMSGLRATSEVAVARLIVVVKEAAPGVPPGLS